MMRRAAVAAAAADDDGVVGTVTRTRGEAYAVVGGGTNNSR